MERGQLVFLDCINAAFIIGAREPLADAEKAVTDAIQTYQASNTPRTILFLDSPDALLATGATTAQQLNDFVFKLRSVVYSAVLTCCADLPLLSAATQSTGTNLSPVEVESARFTAQQAHNARFVMSVRELETGAARDVSGVLRITRSSCSYDLDDAEEPEVREMEALYLVQRDGNVKVFERGADAT